MATIEDYRDEFDPAHAFEVPELYVNGEPTVIFKVQPKGGGTPGKAYALNDWFYEVTVDGEIVLEGDDFRSDAIGKTAEQMSAVLADIIAYSDQPDVREARKRIDVDGSDSDVSGAVDRLVMYRESILGEGE